MGLRARMTLGMSCLDAWNLKILLLNSCSRHMYPVAVAVAVALVYRFPVLPFC